MFEKRKKEIAARRAELRALLTTGGEIDLDAITRELDDLDAEEATLDNRAAIAERLNRSGGGATIPGAPNPILGSVTEARAAEPDGEDRLYRSAWLKTLQGKPLDANEQRAYSTAADSGLAIIPETTANQIIKKMYEVAPILEKCKIFHVPGNFKFAVEGTNEEATKHAENGEITPANDNLGQVNLTGYEIVKLVKASRACSAMALSAFETYIVEVVAESIARKIEKYIFTGNGTTEPAGTTTAGKGVNGAYTDGTDQITVAKTAALTEANIVALYGMLGNGYERNAIWAMRKTTFFSDFFPLMDKGRNNLIEFANGKYYVMGVEVYFTGSLAANEAYLGDYSYIIGNYSQDITVVKSEHSGLGTNSIDFLGSCVFDSKPAAVGAFVHLKKATA